MSITRKWPTARFEHDDEHSSWIAECRAGTGTWVIVQRDTDEIIGLMVEFPDDGRAPLVMTEAQRQHLGMTDEVHHALNLGLMRDEDQRSRKRTAEETILERLRNVEARLARIEES